MYEKTIFEILKDKEYKPSKFVNIFKSCKDCEYYKQPRYEYYNLKTGYNKQFDCVASKPEQCNGIAGRFIYAHCSKNMNKVNYYDKCKLE